MTRFLVGAAVVIAGLSGCASPARYIERTGDSGVIAIPSNTNTFPSYNRSEAIALIERHLGPDYEIIEEREVATGKQTFNNQQVNNEQTINSTNPFLPANKRTVQNTTTTQDVTEWRIAYRRKIPNFNTPMMPGMPTGGTFGMTPNPTIQQTQYRGGATGVQPAGGPVPQGGGVMPLGGVPSVAPGGGAYSAGGYPIGGRQ